jgi:hypothetical protein
MVPKPRSRHRYCGVCRSHYEDYMEHTTGADHTAYLSKSHYQVLNADLCKYFQGKIQGERQLGEEDCKAAETTSEEHPPKSNEMSELPTALKVNPSRF